ncbi:hypothetical protein MSG28_007382 [Choristoneura fumiferana]|uniref:Uncharacterized protein n=1 Tax=Choristoneura fumiferana TaxID=7141 RepID=A0ACC0JWU8_CHOFU|nr:hypothetical protein MSG28_007382 [Choristoneura fumiferana]
MSARCGVLVHCVAGVSRSVTVTLAYLMQRHRLSLRDAFELVRARKTDIAPNFHFMRQLHAFEQDLGLRERSASLSKVLEELGVRESEVAAAAAGRRARAAARRRRTASPRTRASSSTAGAPRATRRNDSSSRRPRPRPRPPPRPPEPRRRQLAPHPSH